MASKKKKAKKTTTKTSPRKATGGKKKVKIASTPVPIGEPIVLDVAGAEIAANDEQTSAAKALAIIERAQITNDVELKAGLSWTAEVKDRCVAVDEKRRTFTDPATMIINAANAFFKPAIKSLTDAEKIMKNKISGYINGRAIERDRILGEVAGADDNGRTTLLTQADALLPPKLPGLGLTSTWKGEVTDSDALISWAIENKRLDLLQPNDKALQAATKAKEGDPKIPGWSARPNTVVRVTVDKVERTA